MVLCSRALSKSRKSESSIPVPARDEKITEIRLVPDQTRITDFNIEILMVCVWANGRGRERKERYSEREDLRGGPRRHAQSRCLPKRRKETTVLLVLVAFSISGNIHKTGWKTKKNDSFQNFRFNL